MKKIASLLILLLSVFIHAQNNTNTFEKYPVFPECIDTALIELESCFNTNTQILKHRKLFFLKNLLAELPCFLKLIKKESLKCSM